MTFTFLVGSSVRPRTQPYERARAAVRGVAGQATGDNAPLPESNPAETETGRTPHARRRTWTTCAVAFAVFAGALSYLVGNEIQANTQSRRAHYSLGLTRSYTRELTAALAPIRHDLNVVNGQVRVDSTALDQDTSQLKAVQVALVGAQANVTSKTSTATALQTCLGGVEQALNALAVDDQSRAIGSLDGVRASCTDAVASNG